MTKTHQQSRGGSAIARALRRASMAGALLVIALTAHAGPYGGVVFFGDSLADSGNNAILLDAGNFVPLGFNPGDRTTVPVPGDDFIPIAPYASNRYSNGPVWTDRLATALGFAAVPSLAGGNNFAFGAATSGPTPGVAVPSLRQQVDTYLGATGGVAQSDALYVIEGGGNDVRRATGPAAIQTYADNVVYMVSTLVAAGARNILLATVPDIGVVPSVVALGPVVAAGATALAAGMNAAAAASLAALQLPGSTDIDFLDLFGLLDAMTSDPAQFGFSDVTHACAADLACVQNPDGTFFWDGLHATSAGAGVISRAALAALEVPEPGSFALLAAALVVSVATRRALGARRGRALRPGHSR